MTLARLLFFGVILGTGAPYIQVATAAPAPLFRPVIQSIRNQLPKDMVMRLPSQVPPSDGINTYAVVREYRGGLFAVNLASRPDCDVTACNMGNIFVSRKIPIDKNSGLYESQRSAKQFNLQPGVKGYYYYARSGSAGYRHHVFWKQNGLYFEVESRALSKQQVINMAISMTKESPISSRK